jgi:hypothetical protein
MKSITSVAIVLIAIVIIFSFSTVAADKPEDLPANGPLKEISTMLSEILNIVTEIFGITQSLDANMGTLQTGMDANFTEVDSALEGLQNNLSTFRAETGDNFTEVDSKLDEIQESLGSSNQEVIYHTSGHYIDEGEHFGYCCRNTNTTAIGSVHAEIFRMDQHTGKWIPTWSFTRNNIGYQNSARSNLLSPDSMWIKYEISVSSREIICAVWFEDLCYLPNDLYVQYL